MLSKSALAMAIRAVVLALACALPKAASAGAIVVTSKPIHALVSAELAGVDVPYLLVSGTASPHTYALRPSDAEALTGAKILFRVSSALEPFTIKLVASLPASVNVISLVDAPGMKLLPPRGAGVFGDEDHDHDHDHDHDAGHAASDPHVWLDPTNAAAMARAIHDVVVAHYPDRRARIDANHENLLRALSKLDADLAKQLAPAAEARFLVLHDAYQYLEARYGLAGAGALAATPEPQAGPRRLSALRATVRNLHVACVFAEPGIDTRALATVIEGTNARIVTLDPEGTHLEPGPTLYDRLMRGLAAGMADCLTHK